jgi:thiamine-phosphate pyrophosphorylase
LTGDLARLERIARTLNAAARRRKPASRILPPLLLVSDPVRTPDPVALAERLPRGAGLIYRAFGAADARDVARRLASVARRRGLVLLIGADAVQAKGAGVHLPQRLARRAGALKRARPGVLVTAAAHGLPALIAARRGGADAALLSVVFPSRSPSAGRPLGTVRFAALVRHAGLPVYALGGVTTKNAPRLIGSGAAGLAMVDGLADALRT